ncbi:uncharacterized protein LOC120196158 [Hibiscus syriacus]|uniref:uncharacterized protein LOC120196158 n=1 Tax=Hibiscus syriacus TaxID=106335 RepID=UPI001924383D|nr:uncharacterized protein LOC120196158 [Hibiscus syriacus]
MVFGSGDSENHTRNFYEKLFTSELNNPQPYESRGLFPSLTSVQLNTLSRPFSNEEIKGALFSMGALKASGLDGIHASLYHRNWETVGGNVCRLVKHVLEGGTMEESLNSTLLVLLPKVDNPETITQFRPISLCLVLYKIITKVIVNRIKPILPELVSKCQTSFIPGRSIIDNIVLAQELVHSMRVKKREERVDGHQNMLGNKPSQKVSLHRTSIFFSSNVPSHTKDALAKELSIHKVKDLGTYLGRITLAKSALPTIPYYTMQSTLLPKGTCNELERTIRNFFWGQTSERRGVHLVNWDILCNRLKGVLRSKYKVKERIPETLPHRSGSQLWRSISSLWSNFRSNLSWNIGDGRDAEFWRDDWLSGVGQQLFLIVRTTTVKSMQNNNRKVRNLVTSRGTWNWDKLTPLLPDSILRRLEATPPPLADNLADSPGWSASEQRTFTLRSAYKIIANTDNIQEDKIWEIIAKHNNIPRIRTLLWLIRRESLLTNSERARRNMTMEESCPMCGGVHGLDGTDQPYKATRLLKQQHEKLDYG